MMNSIEKIDPSIWKLINLTTIKEHKWNGTCIMAVTLHQQGIYGLYGIQRFDYKNDFEDFFSYYKEHDKDIGTNNVIDICINKKTKADI